MAARRTRVIAALAIALAMVAGPTVPAGAQVAQERRFFVVAGLFCVGPGPVHGVLAGAVYFGQNHMDVFRFCEAGDPPHLQVFEVRGVTASGGGGGSSDPGATCRTVSHVTVCTLPDRVSRVVAVFGVFPQPPPPAFLRQVSRLGG